MTTSAERIVTSPADPAAAHPAAVAGLVDPVAQGYRIPISTPARAAHVLTTLADSMTAPSSAAGPANVVMQLIDPPVAYGVMESPVESGALYKHPIKRTRTTFTYLAVAVLGTADDKKRYREAVNTAHRQVRSTEKSPVKYNAMDRNLQLWVAMCLYVGFEDTHTLLRGPMSPEQRALFYRDAAPLGTTLQVHPDQWPATPEEFDAVWVELCRTKIAPTPDTRDYLRQLVDLTFVGTVPGPLKAFSRFQTAGFLAPKFREAMEIEWSARDQRLFDGFWRLVGFANRFVPTAIGQLPYRLLLTDMRTRAKLGRPLV
ncbi:oxygenase MpaB family protein [Tsukamurella strandjordii]|uniref:Oxygenase MpaB family protein n=1 Tax=Tsukamurella strandjordii TaxID=147577 RepID=A0AA90ND62_9ACTN|nr:oxygenase MpaB family protein [Tsukamurella strandjordii]MDP0399670.1 oxygenase MpaB family protein [Tsukamurella strandjordii]